LFDCTDIPLLCWPVPSSTDHSQPDGAVHASVRERRSRVLRAHMNLLLGRAACGKWVGCTKCCALCYVCKYQIQKPDRTMFRFTAPQNQQKTNITHCLPVNRSLPAFALQLLLHVLELLLQREGLVTQLCCARTALFRVGGGRTRYRGGQR